MEAAGGPSRCQHPVVAIGWEHTVGFFFLNLKNENFGNCQILIKNWLCEPLCLCV